MHLSFFSPGSDALKSGIISSSVVPTLSLNRLGTNSATENLPQRERQELHSPVTAVSVAFNPSDTGLTQRLMKLQELNEMKRILRHGTNEPSGKPIWPFKFCDPGGNTIVFAEAAGLEGFVFSERKFSRQFGEAISVSALSDYFHYTLTLLNGATKTQPARETIQEIRDSDLNQNDKYVKFITYLREYVGELQNAVSQLDDAHWSVSTRMYHVPIRSFNLAGWREVHGIQNANEDGDTGRLFRDLTKDDLTAIKDVLSCDSVRWMGTYPIGKIGAKGSGGGSPFAAQRFEVSPFLGNQEEIAEHVRLAATCGVRAIFELVLNHTAIDSDMLEHNPRLFVHTRVPPRDIQNYYHHTSKKHGEFWIRYGGHFDEGTGQRAYFTDVLQLDLSNRDTRDLLIAQAKDLIRNYGVQGFRVDMAYKLRNDRFRQCWGRELSNYENGQREFLQELMTAVKVSFPGVAFIAEAFSGWDELSEDGFDLIYGLDDMALRGGGQHLGWHNSLLSRDPQRIRDAIQRAEFLHWQSGGADMLAFWGQHDKPAFWRMFENDWKWGAALLTLMRPGALSILAGTEAEFEDPCEEDQKVVTFNRHTSTNWDGVNSEFGKFQITTLKTFQALEKKWGKLTFEQLSTPRGENWVGYLVRPLHTNNNSADNNGKKVLILANPTSEPTSVTINQPELGVTDVHFSLERCGPKGNAIISL